MAGPAALAAAALLAACGAGAQGPASGGGAQAPRTTPGGGADEAATRPPTIYNTLRATRAGVIETPAITELSGLVASPDQAGVLWAHNDSGDLPRIWALRPGGAALAELAVPGAEAVDWEDMAIGPVAPGARPRALYLGDIGDNAAARAAIDIYRVPEPQLPAAGATAAATRLRFRYPDGAHDAETLLAEPRTGELAIVTKRFDGDSRVYLAAPSAVAAAARGAVVSLRRGPRIRLGFGGAATAGDVSADGRVVAVRTYSGLVAWRKAPGASLAATLRRRACRGRVSLVAEGQGEALALTRTGRAFFTAPEGGGAAIRRYAPR